MMDTILHGIFCVLMSLRSLFSAGLGAGSAIVAISYLTGHHIEAASDILQVSFWGYVLVLFCLLTLPAPQDAR